MVVVEGCELLLRAFSQHGLGVYMPKRQPGVDVQRGVCERRGDVEDVIVTSLWTLSPPFKCLDELGGGAYTTRHRWDAEEPGARGESRWTSRLLCVGKLEWCTIHCRRLLYACKCKLCTIL